MANYSDMEINDIIVDITDCPFQNIIDIIPDDIIDKKYITNVFEEIINESLSSVFSVAEPFLINVSGIPGSGKSTYCQMLLNNTANREIDCSNNVLYISFDKIMEDHRLPFLMEVTTSPQLAFEKWELPARIVGYELLKRAVEKRVNILFDHSSAIIIQNNGTCEDIKKPHVELFKFIISRDYIFHYRYVFIYDNEAKRRCSERAKSTHRIVPENYIKDRSNILRGLLDEYIKLSDTYKKISQCELKL